MQKTTLANKENCPQNWYIIDAADQIVGRVAVAVAKVLQGKNKPTYTPFLDTGDAVVIINADKVRFTGNKEQQKVYIHHTLYPGGLKEISFKEMMAKHPECVLEEAIRRMLPKTKLGRKMVKKFYIYAGTDHPHQAQQPIPLDLLKKGA